METRDSATLRPRALALFERVVDLGAPERDAVLREACAAWPELRALVDSLLAAHAATHELLDAHPSRLLELLADDESPDLALPYGGRINGYRLIAEAGRGGMATVYEAEREVNGVRERVALKLVRRGIDTDDVLRRFAHETHVLASLEHPNIARFHDVGTTPDGRPYLVMEFIEGQPLTTFCDERHLDIQLRLALFETVCRAVQYAHQYMLVHRDIKPSNILVTKRGDVKLLDFGIAKLLTEGVDTAAPRTRTGFRVLTPEYAAPEQLRGEPVTPVTDIYALGLVLHELLVGSRPSNSEGDAVSEGYRLPPGNPAPPSTTVGRATRKGLAAEIAAARDTTPEKLRRALEGDLDSIVLKALAAGPAQRYQSAQQLVTDLDRHRSGVPVHARPDALGRFGRPGEALRRLLGGASGARWAATAVVIFALVAITGVILREVATADPSIPGTSNTVAHDHFLRANDALKQRTPASVIRAISEYRAASALDPAFVAALAREAYAYALFVDWGWSYPGLSPEALLARGLELTERAILRDSLSADAWLSDAYLRVLRDPYTYAGAIPAFERAIALDPSSAEAYHQYGQALMTLGRYREASAAYHAALAIEPDRPLTLVPLAAIASRERHRIDQLRWADSAIAVAPRAPYAWAARARERLAAGDPARARADAEHALRIDPSYELPSRTVLASALVALGDSAEARAQIHRAQAALADRAQPSSTEAYFLADAWLNLGEPDSAISLLDRARPRGAWLWFYFQDPAFDRLRTDPRFGRIIAESDPRR